MERAYKGCPNPLFEKWLTEMKEQAAANESPIQHSFGKALNSLRKCPIRLETGKDCLILQHFGKKICDLLDRKLEEHKKINNLPSASRLSAIHEILNAHDKGIEGKKAKKNMSNNRVPDQAGPSNARSPVFKVPRNKPYIPKVGSGAYAILTVMYNNMQDPNYLGYMLKKDIIAQAQRHCDSPMKSNAIEHYAGWSSMSTLISKHYVVKKSNPAKYSLSDSGVALALSLIEGRAKHHHDSADDDDDDDDDSVVYQEKSPNRGKRKNEPLISKESDSAKASASGIGNSASYFSDSDDDHNDVLKQNHAKKLKENFVKAKECESTAVNLDGEVLEATLSVTWTETTSQKYHNLTTENEAKIEPVFEDELEMALALSLKGDTGEDEDLKKALEISLNESKMQCDSDTDGQDYLPKNAKLIVKGMTIQDSETDMNKILKTALVMSTEEANLRAAHANNSFNDGIICLDDDNDDDVITKRVPKNDYQAMSQDKNVDCNESFIEFCKENAESTLCVKKKSEHFIFVDGPSIYDSKVKNDKTCVQKKNDVNVDSHGTPNNFREIQKTSTKDIEMHIESVINNMPAITMDNAKDTDFVEEIIISDDDENIHSKISAKIDECNTEHPHDFSNTSKNSDVSPPKFSKSAKEKENFQSNLKTKETSEDVPIDSFTLLPNNFDIVLLVDTQETCGTTKKPADDATISALSDAGVLFEVRSLKVGDFAWIARCRLTRKELILPYIIERKRIDDLGGSITDGRYHEQKHRLRQSGIANVIYLIEHYGKIYHGAIPLTSLFQAGINTTVQDGFITKFTRDHKNSMFYLSALTKKLIRMYRGKRLTNCLKKFMDSVSHTSDATERLMEFCEFNKAALKTKQFTVREMLIKQLVQLKGISAEKAIGIAEKYPSPLILAEAFRNGGKNLLADIEVGSSRRKVGPTISNILHIFYTRANLN